MNRILHFLAMSLLFIVGAYGSGNVTILGKNFSLDTEAM